MTETLAGADLDRLSTYVNDTIGDRPDAWPGGWPGEVDAALIDAIFSVRARYGNRTTGTGVYGVVQRWRFYRSQADDLAVLKSTSEADLVQVTNKGRLAGRTKARVALDAATALADAGVLSAKDFGEKLEAAERAYRSVKGCGPVTWAYLRMLLGYEDVKPDTWVMRFVQDQLPHVRTAHEAGALLKGVAGRLGVDARDLDHAVWRYRRSV
ncbi:hypothetical protein [Nocardioides daphniae]|uniref:HhH-GPD domain-containing protein n=1 Tax=Nocardioides daphniae TaxID=402297 RepID=A0A4P7UES1_9ACTN|nr:hypothetical protein [Nocardioides daphniae]QCC77409.1 hypothetical protein E2C04_09835 [Nocardioides daphniae]GGD24528.1 hypothetical protein GCM10007231_24650 [Nocardioides daphniae]